MTDYDRLQVVAKKQDGYLEVRNQLVLSKLHIVQRIMRQYRIQDPDLFQEGAEALIKAIDQYKLQYDEKAFDAFAFFRVRKAILIHRRRNALPLNVPLSVAFSSAQVETDLTALSVPSSESLVEMWCQIEQLPEKERIALLLSCFEGLSATTIGLELGVSRKWVERLISQARGKIEQ